MTKCTHYESHSQGPRFVEETHILPWLYERKSSSLQTFDWQCRQPHVAGPISGSRYRVIAGNLLIMMWVDMTLDRQAASQVPTIRAQIGCQARMEAEDFSPNPKLHHEKDSRFQIP
jgi:hypothetical protein